MALFNRANRCGCAIAAVAVSVVAGALAAYVQITGMITFTSAFLWVAFGIAARYLAVMVAAAAQVRRVSAGLCVYSALHAVQAGSLGTILLAVVLLADGTAATGGILVGLLMFFFTLMLAGSAWFLRDIVRCEA